jgi:CxxC-x17-CxxC domain-containing protein
MAFYQQDAGGNSGGQGGYGGSRGGFAPRQMIDVSSMGIKCAGCGTAITELPFQPSTDRPVYCRDCHRQRRQSYGGPRSF